MEALRASRPTRRGASDSHRTRATAGRSHQRHDGIHLANAVAMLSWRDIKLWTVTLSLEDGDSFDPHSDCASLPRMNDSHPVTRTMASPDGCTIAIRGRLGRNGERPVAVAGTIAGPGHYVIGRGGVRRCNATMARSTQR